MTDIQLAALALWAGIVVASLLILLMVGIQVQIEADVAKVKRMNREWEAQARQQRDGYAVLLEEAHSEIGGALQDLEYVKSDIEHGHLDQALRWLCKAEVCLHRADPGTDDRARQIVAAVEGMANDLDLLLSGGIEMKPAKDGPVTFEAMVMMLQTMRMHLDAYRGARGAGPGDGGETR